MQRSASAALLAAVVASFSAGCDSGDPLASDAFNRNMNFDAAVVAADGALEDLRMMHGPRLGLASTVFPPLVGDRPDCPESDDIFLCPPFEREGFTYTRTIEYLDADGNPQDGYDEATTASIHYQISIEGEIGREWWSGTIERSRELTVTGLLDDDGLVTWNGTGAGDVLRSRHTDGGDRSYNIVSSGNIDDVVIPYPRTEDGWPLSGTITREMTITRTSDTGGTETMERTVSIAFNGTNLVTVTVGDETFTLDLSLQRHGPRGRRHGGGMGRIG